MIADEVLKRDEERRRRRDEGAEEDEEMPVAEEGRQASGTGDVKPRIMAKTRVSVFLPCRDHADDVAEIHRCGGCWDEVHGTSYS